VDILFDSIRRNLAEGFEGDFTCFTDQDDELADGIIVRPLPANLPGWWSKLALFQDGLFRKGDRVIFFDLDTVLTGRLDEFAAYDGPLAILRDFYRPDGLQSAVMAWRAGEDSEIWTSFLDAACPMDDPNGDQAWIETARPNAVRLQEVFPCVFTSYKADNLAANPPAKASVVVFHGRPRPHEVLAGWVPEVWKIGGMTRAELDTVCNTNAERLLSNVRGAIARDLRWFDTAEAHDGHVVLVGGGPNVRDKIEEIRWRQSIGQSVWAMNGSGRYLAGHGISPDVYVLLDARPENAGFLFESRETEFLLASQCDPAVLDIAPEKTTLFHVNMEGMTAILAGETERPVHLIGGGSTVGLNAMVLAFAAGFRKFHLYGYDSSLSEAEHHAYEQRQNDGDIVVDAIFGGRKFKTTPWMAQQVNEFQALATGLVNDGCIITVSGDGLLPAVARSMTIEGIKTPPEIRAAEILKRIDGISSPRGAEIGVFAADMSSILLRGRPDLSLTLVDSWEGDGAAYTGDSDDFHASLTQDAQEGFYARAREKVAFANGRAPIVRKRSTEAAAEIADGSLDFVFIDADHSYEGCRADILAWLPKVKPGRVIGGHDFDNGNFPKFGVTKAVREFIDQKALKLELGENFTWFARTPSKGEL
jgi:hypothetical protein